MFKFLLHISIWILSLSVYAQTVDLVKPIDNTISVDSSNVFAWNRYPKATSYLFQVDKNNNFSTTSINIVTSKNHLTIDSLPFSNVFFWRVLAYSPSDTLTSEVRTFTLFSPKEIPSLALWLNSDIGITADTLKRISHWQDQSLLNNHANQANPLKRPQLEDSCLNNHRITKYNGEQSLMVNNLTIGAFSIFSFWKSNNSKVIYEHSTNAGVNDGVLLLSTTDCSSFIRRGTSNSGYNNLDPIWGNNEYKVVSHLFGGTHSSHRLSVNKVNQNLAPCFDTDDNPGTTNITKPLFIGSRANNSLFLDGSIGEIIVFNDAVNDSIQKLIESYLTFKFAPPVCLGLDVTVPYGFCDSLITLTTPKGYKKYLWSTGDTTRTIKVLPNNTYTITTVNIFGDTTTDKISILPPNIPLGDTLSLCKKSSTILNTGLGLGYTFLWSTGSTDSTIMVDSAGLYTVQITDTNGCSVTDSVWVVEDNILIAPSITNNFNLCLGNQITLSANAPLDSILWNTGENTSLITPLLSQDYNVTAVSANGCILQDTVTISIVGTVPLVNFSQEQVCLGDTTQFRDLSTDTSGNTITQWYWDFGNGDTSVFQNPKYVFSNIGDKPIHLKITSNVGCSNSLTKRFRIHALPKPNFEFPIANCADAPILFTDQSEVSNLDSIIAWQWNFGDESISDNQNPTHRFENSNIYNTRLQIKTREGCQADTSKNITVSPALIADFSFEKTCLGDSTKFKDLSTSAVQWEWNFGDGSISDNQNPTHIFDTSITYNIGLSVQNRIGCRANTHKIVSILTNPIARFDNKDACFKNTYAFIDNSIESNMDPINQWTWQIETLDTSLTGQIPTFSFPDTGIHKVTLHVSTPSGCSADTSKTVFVSPLPIAAFSFSPSLGEAPLDISFTNLSLGAQEYLWNFASNENISEKNPQYTFTTNKDFTVSLRAINTSGCMDSTKQIISVRPTNIDLLVDEIFITENTLINGTQVLEARVRLINNGTEPIWQADLLVQVGNRSPVIETITDTIPVGQSIVYKLNTKPILSTVQPIDFLCLQSTNINQNHIDSDTSNNTNCINRSEEINIAGLYPNPCKDHTSLFIVSNKETKVNISIYDSWGQMLRNIPSTSLSNRTNNIRINLSNIQNGTYFLKIDHKDNVKILPFVILK